MGEPDAHFISTRSSHRLHLVDPRESATLLPKVLNFKKEGANLLLRISEDLTHIEYPVAFCGWLLVQLHSPLGRLKSHSFGG